MSDFDDNTEYSMILVMGVTGSGKSYFINKLVEDSVTEGSGLRSGKQLEEQECQGRFGL